eukprot:TRINITY_DN44260_c0_g1_i1.p1 TRINITY_DN44260_c0_g1~~TRINITY_DN44260_c0_g1_i1.p1  ORF type:complete len:409 (+),score=42.37 TRINITY_DN44260_c0_g1_i1:72-1298(+)
MTLPSITVRPLLLLSCPALIVARWRSSSTTPASCQRRDVKSFRVGVIGAGISGLSAASHIQELIPGVSVTVMEWGRGPGGRMACRRARVRGPASDEERVAFDHAAPFFSVWTGEFKMLMRKWQKEGVVAPWDSAGERVWVGTPTNHAICKHLAETLQSVGGRMLFGRHVTSANYSEDEHEWVVSARSRGSGEVEMHYFDVLMLSDKLLVLPNQYAVLPSNDPIVSQFPNVTSVGTLVMLLAFKGELGSGLPPLLAELPADSPLSLVVHESAKPQRIQEDSPYDLWVAHSTETFAAAHLQEDVGNGPSVGDEKVILQELERAFSTALRIPSLPPVVHASIMTWDHARPVAGERVAATHLLDRRRLVGVCGDVFEPAPLAEGVEAAALSGRALAEDVASSIKASHTPSAL